MHEMKSTLFSINANISLYYTSVPPLKISEILTCNIIGVVILSNQLDMILTIVYKFIICLILQTAAGIRTSTPRNVHVVIRKGEIFVQRVVAARHCDTSLFYFIEQDNYLYIYKSTKIRYFFNTTSV